MSINLLSRKFWRSKIYDRTPSWLKDYVRHKRRVAQNRALKEKNVQIQENDLIEALSNVGISNGDTLFVHSSADWFRSLEGGPMKVIQLLRDALGEDGTLAMPAFPLTGMAKEYLEREKFDVKRSPSQMGLITEVFRRIPETVRSLHPTHSVCALGAQAEFLISDHEKSPLPFGKASPFGRLIQLNGKVLLLGVDLSSLTLVHSAEDRLGEKFPVRVYLPELRTVEVEGMEGSVTIQTRVHDPAISRIRETTRLEQDLIQNGTIISTQADGVKIRLVKAKLFEDYLVSQAKKGKTVYTG